MSDLEKRDDKKLTRLEKKESKNYLKVALLFLPNLVKLLGKMMVDKRVPVAEKALFVAAIVYVVSPLDFIPDIFPFVGQVDDLYLVALVLLRLLNQTPETVVRENWDGDADIVSLSKTIAGFAPRFLPQRVTRVLTSEVDLAPAAKNFTKLLKNKQSVMTETPIIEETKV